MHRVVTSQTRDQGRIVTFPAQWEIRSTQPCATLFRARSAKALVLEALVTPGCRVPGHTGLFLPSVTRSLQRAQLHPSRNLVRVYAAPWRTVWSAERIARLSRQDL
ncbi:unnamed protein product [Ectocarpus sp. 6 AP-2014]